MTAFGGRFPLWFVDGYEARNFIQQANALVSNTFTLGLHGRYSRGPLSKKKNRKNATFGGILAAHCLAARSSEFDSARLFSSGRVFLWYMYIPIHTASPIPRPTSLRWLSGLAFRKVFHPVCLFLPETRLRDLCSPKLFDRLETFARKASEAFDGYVKRHKGIRR